MILTEFCCYVHLKVEKRIPAWKSVGLSSRGKMILTESCLSTIPTYTMGVYQLQEEIHHMMDTTRTNFFGMDHIRKENITWQDRGDGVPKKCWRGWLY
jgi:hypothetical protein